MPSLASYRGSNQPRFPYQAVEWLGVTLRLVSKNLSSRATHGMRCRPSPSPNVNTYSVPARQSIGRLRLCNRRLRFLLAAGVLPKNILRRKTRHATLIGRAVIDLEV